MSLSGFCCQSTEAAVWGDGRTFKDGALLEGSRLPRGDHGGLYPGLASHLPSASDPPRCEQAPSVRPSSPQRAVSPPTMGQNNSLISPLAFHCNFITMRNVTPIPAPVQTCSSQGRISVLSGEVRHQTGGGRRMTGHFLSGVWAGD